MSSLNDNLKRVIADQEHRLSENGTFKVVVDNENLLIVNTTTLQGVKRFGLTHEFKTDEELQKAFENGVILCLCICRKECARDIKRILGSNFLKIEVIVFPDKKVQAYTWRDEKIDNKDLTSLQNIIKRYM